MARLGFALVILGGFLVIGGAVPHAFAGWPAVAARIPTSIEPATLDGLRVGWMFGSGSMAVMGLLVLFSARFLERQPGVRLVPLFVGLYYLVFGVSAYVIREQHGHFIGFIVMGVILLAGTALITAGSRAARG